MNYEEAMNFIQNTSKFGSVLGLDNIKELLERLGNPQDQLKVVHIAGTNGKDQHLHFLQESSEKVDIVRGGMSPRHLFATKRDFASMKRTFRKKICAFIWKNKENFRRDGERRDVTSDNV